MDNDSDIECPVDECGNTNQKFIIKVGENEYFCEACQTRFNHETFEIVDTSDDY